MIIQNAATLHLRENARLIVDATSTLIIDAGAIINLQSAGSKIRIEGTLVINGDFNFTGLGYFEFATGNDLVYGSGYNTFRLEGAGTTHRFIRIDHAELKVPAGKNIMLVSGAVEYAGGSSLYLEAGSGGDFISTQFYNRGAPCIQGLGAGSGYVRECIFDNVDHVM